MSIDHDETQEAPDLPGKETVDISADASTVGRPDQPAGGSWGDIGPRLMGPRWRRPRPGLHWVGPTLVVSTTLAAWFSVSSATGSGTPAFGLFVGLGSIVLMAWSFVLAVRLRPLEPLFGGLDRVYTAHRWSGMIATLAMFLHVRFAPDQSGGVPGASSQVADTAQELAGVGEIALYVLIGISILRWIPYRWWRLTHKLLGVPFAFASWHTWTALKPYANTDPWGWYFTVIMAAGLLAWLWRVLGRDVFARGHRYRVVSTTPHDATTEIELEPIGKPLRFEAGQFAVLKLDSPGLREPHIFTIASTPEEPHLRFFIRDLGDWTHRIRQRDLTNITARVEGPYGHLRPLPHRASHRTSQGAVTGSVTEPVVEAAERSSTESSPRVVWVAGGVGITPFLSAIGTLSPVPQAQRPTLLYCVRNLERATAIEVLEAAADQGRITLVPIDSARGQRFSPEILKNAAGGDLTGAHVAACGPRGLINAVAVTARAAGARVVETENFDIRSGLGPDLSRWWIHDLTTTRVRRPRRA